MKKVSYKRHLAKTITWRTVGTIDTIILSWMVTGNPLTGLKIGSSEVITKMLLYYLHERVWLNVNIEESRKRHLLKTASWRMVGTLDTIVLSWFFTQSPLMGLQIGAFEVISKMLLYYLHERVWYKSNFGLNERNI